MSVDYQRRAFFMTGRPKRVNADVHLPWLKSAEDFLEKCTQCGECLKHCPENIIEKGDGGYPTVNFKLGECTYCQSCAKQCPENLFDIEMNKPWDLALTINNSCLPKKGIVCQSCRDVCEPQAMNFSYKDATVPTPQVDASLCTSCGACISSCPVGAISLCKKHKSCAL